MLITPNAPGESPRGHTPSENHLFDIVAPSHPDVALHVYQMAKASDEAVIEPELLF